MPLKVGVDIGGTKTSAILLGDEGAVMHKVVTATSSGGLTQSVMATIDKVIAGRDEIESIGLALAAAVDRETQKPFFAPNVDFDSDDIVKEVSDRYGVPAVGENDANCAAWAEVRFGAAHGCTNVVLLTLGTGVGGGIVIDGRLYRGARGFAAELGHMTVNEGGDRCACGLDGCLEAYASGTAIGERARQGVASSGSMLLDLARGDASAISGAMVADAAAAGDEFSLRVLADVGHWLGVGLASIAAAFDPEVIVLGGGGAGAGEPLIGPARQVLVERRSERGAAPRLVVAKLGNDAGAIGAADLSTRKGA